MVNRARNMHDVITYWAPTGVKNQFGKPSWNAPVTLKGRWEDAMNTVLSKHGKEYVSKSRVFVVEALSLDGYLFNGTSAAADPTEVTGAREIQALGRMNDLRSMSSLTAVYL